MSLDAVLARIDADLPQALERLMELLRIPSISTDPAFKPDCARAADWLVADLQTLGFTAASRPTPGHPMVVGHGGEGGRHLLFYGHYDVQPVDPLELWARDPFDPQVEDTPKGKVIRARGSSDDKGQLMTFLEACRAWKAVHGSLPGKLTIFLEGEEESGSPSLIPFLRENAAELRADLALICDTGLFEDAVPAITTMLRGLCKAEFTVRAASRDLHSGMYGGPALNPIKVLANLIATLHDTDGRVAVPGFYDGVEELPDAIATQWRGLGFDEKGFLGEAGLSVASGEQNRSVLEKIWARPTCEINGVFGGYTGEGFKTVIPAGASAKISFRLVGKQDPLKIRNAFRTYLTEKLPAGAKIAFHDHGASAALELSADSPALALAARGLQDEWDKEPLLMGSGGSIPIVGAFKRELGMDTLLIGFALDDDRIHSPNEKYELSSFHKGTRSWARILARLAEWR